MPSYNPPLRDMQFLMHEVFKVTESYQKAVDTLRAQEGMVLILGTAAAVSYDPKADVTQKVIDLMNASPVTFERMQAERTAEPSTNGTSTAAPSTNATSPSTNGTAKP